MLKTYRYRLKPTKSQVTILERQLELCRFVYNDTLAYRKNAWEFKQRTVKRFETQDRLPQLKLDVPELKDVYSLVLQNVALRVELAFKAFFRRVKSGEEPGYPRFKGKSRYDSITYSQSGFELDSEMLHLSKMGDIPLPPWKDGSVVGIDVGLASFATLSNGEKIDNPRFFREDELALAKAQSKRDKLPKGSSLRRKASKAVARIHERIGDKRTDFSNQVSRQLVNRFGVIVFEDLDIQSMLKNHHLAKSISDVAWGMLVKATESKAAYAGSKVVLVDPKYTSQMCSRCGMIVKKDLSERIHNCSECGLTMDRDLNAAINILRLGMQSVRKSDRSPVL
jgi:putative transposase